MDKEAIEKTALRLHNHPKLEQSLGLDNDHIIIDRRVYDAIVSRFGISWFNYRKFPQGKPRLLGDEEIRHLIHSHSSPMQSMTVYQYGDIIAQAQREADIKHYESCDYSNFNLCVCPECGKYRPDDEGVKNGMKCAFCAYGNEG